MALCAVSPLFIYRAGARLPEAGRGLHSDRLVGNERAHFMGPKTQLPAHIWTPSGYNLGVPQTIDFSCLLSCLTSPRQPARRTDGRAIGGSRRRRPRSNSRMLCGNRPGRSEPPQQHSGSGRAGLARRPCAPSAPISPPHAGMARLRLSNAPRAPTSPQPRVDFVLMVCPKAICCQWRNELWRRFGLYSSRSAANSGRRVVDMPTNDLEKVKEIKDG